MNIAVAGTGYVGLVTAVCLAEKGHQVVCVDIDQTKVQRLNHDECPIYEKDLQELMVKNKSKLSYVTNGSCAYRNADVIFVCVATPEKKDGSANLKYVYEVIEEITNDVQKNCIIVMKSTVPIGTNDKIAKMLNEGKKENISISVVSNPEFLAQGTAVQDTLCASRIVIGVEEDWAKEKMLDLYRDFDAPKLVTNRCSAEMIKYASNDFLALKISYINEIANLCEKIGADIADVAQGMGYDERIGNKFLNPGIGYGGSCFPKDTKALHWLSNFHDHEIKTIKAAIEVNENQKLKLLKKARRYYESFDGLTVAVLGLTFKPETDDLREAPSLVNIPLLLDEQAKVKVYDPVGMERFKMLYPNEVTYCSSIEETLEKSDICFIFTEWKCIKEYPIGKFKELMNKAIIIDGRNCFLLEEVIGKGIIYESIGRKCITI